MTSHSTKFTFAKKPECLESSEKPRTLSLLILKLKYQQNWMDDFAVVVAL